MPARESSWRDRNTERRLSLMQVVLLEPEIPPNTGNVARLCAATNSVLHLIEPLGFEITDRQLKRVGMDYWKYLEWKQWPDWTAFQRALAPKTTLWFVECKGPKRYTEVEFGPNDCLVFGRESAGIPEPLLHQNAETWLRIPMFNSDARSLNLGNSVSLVLYEALRQQSFPGEV